MDRVITTGVAIRIRKDPDDKKKWQIVSARFFEGDVIEVLVDQISTLKKAKELVRKGEIFSVISDRAMKIARHEEAKRLTRK